MRQGTVGTRTESGIKQDPGHSNISLAARSSLCMHPFRLRYVDAWDMWRFSALTTEGTMEVLSCVLQSCGVKWELKSNWPGHMPYMHT